MAANDLLFSGAANGHAQPVDIVFGDEPAQQSTVQLNAQGTITHLRGHVGIARSALVRMAGAITGLRGRLPVAYDVNVERPTVCNAPASWQTTAAAAGAIAMATYGTPLRTAASVRMQWAGAAPRSAIDGDAWADSLRLRVERSAAHQQALGLPIAPLRAFHQDAQRLRYMAAVLHERAIGGLGDVSLQRHQDAIRLRAMARVSHQVATAITGTVHRGMFGAALPFALQWRERHQNAMRPPAGTSRITPPVTPPFYVPGADLLFTDPALPYQAWADIVFQADGGGQGGNAGEPIIVPILRVYIVSNDVILRRVSDNIEVPCINMALSLDASSWSWGFDASLPASALDMVQPDSNGPVELQAVVNGTSFRVLAEGIARERVFGQSTLRVSGRGRNAELDAPYAPTAVFGNAAARTHQQLFSDVLSINGVSMGYTIDYQLQDWQVPAGVWSVQGTYIGALASLAQAAGAYLRPHPSALAFAVLPLYPAWPLASATPDIILPPDVLTKESITWADRPGYNRVFVSGQNQGVLAQVTRSGTAGDVLAPMVTDALITDITAARQRAISIFGATGRKLDVSLSLPVLPATGVIQPGTYVQYADGAATRLGIVRSVSVQVDGQVSVLQTIGVEAHA